MKIKIYIFYTLDLLLIIRSQFERIERETKEPPFCCMYAILKFYLNNVFTFLFREYWISDNQSSLSGIHLYLSHSEYNLKGSFFS